MLWPFTKPRRGRAGKDDIARVAALHVERVDQATQDDHDGLTIGGIAVAVGALLALSWALGL